MKLDSSSSKPLPGTEVRAYTFAIRSFARQQQLSFNVTRQFWRMPETWSKEPLQSPK
jgi:hypothetical protein